MQMTQRPVWATLGTSGLRSFRPPDGVARIILAPDGDEAGHVAARAAAVRFKEMGIEVLGTSPPPELDWCDLAAASEERAGIRELGRASCRDRVRRYV